MSLRDPTSRVLSGRDSFFVRNLIARADCKAAQAAGVTGREGLTDFFGGLT